MSNGSLEYFTEIVSKAVGRLGDEPANKDVVGRLKYVIEDVGTIFVDANSRPCLVSNVDEDADCVIELASDAMEDMYDKHIDSVAIFRQGRLRLIGDLSVVIRLGNSVQRSI